MNNSVLLSGDLSRLTPEEKITYYNDVCNSVGLNPLTKPLEYITLNGKLTLYAKRDATEQLRKIHQVSITRVFNQTVNDVFIVTAEAEDRTGRRDSSTGAVAIGNLKGDSLANALMKAETKAKRRVTLSICGLGMLDETEIESIKDAKTFTPEIVKEVQLLEKALTDSAKAETTVIAPPEPKRRGRKPKEHPPIENHNDAITQEKVEITDNDIPDFDDRVPTAEEKKEFAEKARSFTDYASIEDLRGFILSHASVLDPRDLTIKQWKAALAVLDEAKGDKTKLKEILQNVAKENVKWERALIK